MHPVEANERQPLKEAFDLICYSEEEKSMQSHSILLQTNGKRSQPHEGTSELQFFVGSINNPPLTCEDGSGHLFREELSKFKGAFACFGGSEPLPGWFGALMQ